MKCPKCGINDLTFNDLNYIGNKCSQCRNQQRLDKVLSKFKKSKYEKMIQIDLCIIFYENNKFHLGTWYNGLELEISLDTVESLLKDLEDE